MRLRPRGTLLVTPGRSLAPTSARLTQPRVVSMGDAYQLMNTPERSCR